MGIIVYLVLNNDHDEKRILHSELVSNNQELEERYRDLLIYYKSQLNFVVEVFDHFFLATIRTNPEVEIQVKKLYKNEKKILQHTFQNNAD